MLLGLLQTGAWCDNYIVTSREDSGPGTLRTAVAASNTTTGTHTIIFNIPGGNSITVFSMIDITAPVTIDGNKTQVIGAYPIQGANYDLVLDVGSDGSTITGLALINAGSGIAIESNNNIISGCRIGMDWSGNNQGNVYGIMIYAGSNNLIGGSSVSARNIISGNITNGIQCRTVHNEHSKIIGNYIGTDANGLNPGAYQGIGIYVRGVGGTGTQGTLQIGGNYNLGEGNLISGNYQGIELGTFGNTICGNIIGLNYSQNGVIPNGYGILYGAYANIGLPQVGFFNVIAGNSICGICASYSCQIQNNYIGINSSSVKYANNIGVSVAFGNLIGGGQNLSLYERNVISGNSTGIYTNNSDNIISGNLIGTDITGMGTVGNTIGIQIDGGSGNLIGGSNADPNNLQGNIISGQVSNTGILLSGGAGNTIEGNTIGLNLTGSSAIPNLIGISLAAGNTGTVVGGSTPDLRNVISGNSDCGIDLNGSTGHQIFGNYIGLNAAGSSVIQNTNADVRFTNASLTTLGGADVAHRNVICGSTNGILAIGSGSYGNTFSQNWLGVLPSGAPSPLPMACAINISGSAHDNFVDTQSWAGNLLANMTDGIRLAGPATLHNGLFSNTITAFTGNAIWLANDGANANLPAPVIYTAETNQIKGTSSANNYIQIFISDRGSGSHGGSLSLLGAATADASGTWTFAPTNLANGQYVCALATDANNNTSGFSLNAQASGATASATPTPVPTPTATPTPIDTLNLGDNQIKALHNQINP
jgi:hypothetical protein